MVDVLDMLENLWGYCRGCSDRGSPLGAELITEIWAKTPETSQLRIVTLDELARMLVITNGNASEYEICFLQIPGFGASLTDAICGLKRVGELNVSGPNEL